MFDAVRCHYYFTLQPLNILSIQMLSHGLSILWSIEKFKSFIQKQNIQKGDRWEKKIVETI